MSMYSAPLRMLDLAEQLPEVAFHGLDVGASAITLFPLHPNLRILMSSTVPIGTRYPPDNVTFHIHDCKGGLIYPSATFDVVHGRLISLGVSLMLHVLVDTRAQ